MISILATAKLYLCGLLDIVFFLLHALVAGAHILRMHYSERGKSNEHVPPQGIGSVDSETIMPSRNIALFNQIMLDHVDVRQLARHKC